MSDDKVRFWLKLDKGFMKSSQIKVIRSLPNGNDYIIFYLTLMLESIEGTGHLRFSEFVPYDESMLASITDTNIDIVKNAIEIFTKLGLMQFLSDGTIFMTEVPKMTGREGDSAERVRRFREKNRIEKIENVTCNANVTNSNANIEYNNINIIEENNIKEKHTFSNSFSQKCENSNVPSFDFKDDPDFDEKIIDPKNTKALTYAAKRVLHFLNVLLTPEGEIEKKKNVGFREVDSNLIPIISRLKSGATVSDCMGVIKTKIDEWINNAEMCKFIRPITLFGKQKFEGYLVEYKQKYLK